MRKYLILFGSVIVIWGCTSKVVEKPIYIEKPIVVEKPVYVKPEMPPLPQRPKLDAVFFQKIGDNYCLTEVEAKKLLKNLYLLDNYARELENILQTLQQGEDDDTS